MDAPGCGTIFIHQLGDCHEGTPEGSCMQVRRHLTKFCVFGGFFWV